MPFTATWIHLEVVILSEAIRTEKDKYHRILVCVESKKYDTDKLIYKTEMNSNLRDCLYGYQGEGCGDKIESLRLIQYFKIFIFLIFKC